LPDLQRIINLLPKERQNLMFSATFSPEIKKLAASFLKDPVTIEVARSNATADNVTQVIYKVEEEAKRDAVLYILRERALKQVIVFSNTKIGASRLARHLEKEGVNASAIHGDKTQAERMAALEAFKNGSVEVLVATDVAARGLDISEMPCVINYDLPYNAEDYVHRIGRTGRAGASGDAISLYSDKDARLLADIEKLTKHKISRIELAGFVPMRSSERRPRGEEREGASGSRGAQYGRSAYAPRKEKVDPWFLKPYEPEVPANSAQEEGKDSNQQSAGKPQKKVAALLGGTPKR
jgi:superfamily II DNA/RNA helicase